MIKYLISTFFILSTAIFGEAYKDYNIHTEHGISARSIALGSVEGFSNSATSIFDNPAGLYRVKNYSLSIFKSTIMDYQVFYNSVAFAGTTPFGKIGFGFYEAASFEIPETGVSTIGGIDKYVITDNFDFKSSIYKFSYQGTLKPNLYVGTSYTLYSQRFYDVNGKGSNFDAGLIYKGKKTEYSGLIRNLFPNAKVRYSNYDPESLPTHIVVSAKRKVWKLESFTQIKKVRRHYLPSLAFKIAPKQMSYIQFMTGFKEQLDVTYGRNKKWTFGIGLDLFDVHFNYAYERSDYILQDGKNYFSMNYNF
jgi:hypothetical protein